MRITRPFYLGATEVTRGQFRRFVDEAGYQTEAEKDGKGGYGWNEEKKTFEQDPRYTWQNAGFEQTDEHPVVNVSWNDAVAFAAWLSRKEGRTYRLPTEAEWEYACRAGTTTRYSSGDDPEGLAAVGNVGGKGTAPVGRYNPNAWGLFDMHGNVWEWCSDGYAADYYKRSPVDDPQGAEGAADRVARGGGWSDGPRFARSACRRRCAAGVPGTASWAFAWPESSPSAEPGQGRGTTPVCGGSTGGAAEPAWHRVWKAAKSGPSREIGDNRRWNDHARKRPTSTVSVDAPTLPTADDVAEPCQIGHHRDGESGRC